MADKGAFVSYRGHILCCVSVVFVCFLLCTLNLYMLSSVRSVLRRLETRLDSKSSGPAAAMSRGPSRLMDQMLDPDFLLLDPSDLENAWTTQNGQMLVPRGPPEEEDDGWRQMQTQLQEQLSHIGDLHDTVADQFRAHGELQRSQQDLLREHGQLHRDKQEAAEEHAKELARRDRKILKQRKKVLDKVAKHQDQLRLFQERIDELNRKLTEKDQTASTTTEQMPGSLPVVDNGTVILTQVVADPLQSNESTTASSLDPVLEVIEDGPPPPSADEESTSAPTEKESIIAEVAPTEKQPQVFFHPLDHIFSAVFGPNPGDFFYPSAIRVREETDPMEHHVVNRNLDEGEEEAAGVSSRKKRDLASLRAARAARHQQWRQLRELRRHHKQESSGPYMISSGGDFVPLPGMAPASAPAGSNNYPMFVVDNEQPARYNLLRDRRRAHHG